MTTPDAQDRPPRIDLRIPGRWESPLALEQALKETGYTVAYGEEGALVHTATGRRFQLGAGAPDHTLASLFADSPRIRQEELDAIGEHTVKVFLSGPGGSIEAAQAILAAGAAVIKAGGLGVFVDNGGAVHSPQDWLDLASDPTGGIYWAFVTLNGDADAIYTIGMHCLGFRDAEMPRTANVQAAVEMLHNFLGYSYQSGQTILNGEVTDGPEGEHFKIVHRPCTRFEPHTAFFNPYGVWRLEKVKDSA